MGRMAGLFVAFRDSWDKKSELFDEVGVFMQRDIAAFFSDKIQTPGNPMSNAEKAAGSLLGYRHSSGANWKLHRGTVYSILDDPWPKSRYDNWNDFSNAFIQAAANQISVTMPPAEQMGRLASMLVTLQNLWNSKTLKIQALCEISYHLKKDLTGYFVEQIISVGHPKGHAFKAAGHLIQYPAQLHRHTVYNELGKPLEKDRYSNWNDFYKAFSQAAN